MLHYVILEKRMDDGLMCLFDDIRVMEMLTTIMPLRILRFLLST